MRVEIRVDCKIETLCGRLNKAKLRNLLANMR